MESPACKTPPQFRATSATQYNTTPQTTVTYLASRSQYASSFLVGRTPWSWGPSGHGPPAGIFESPELGIRPTISGFQKSMTVVDASEFNAALRLDMAAARIAAITRPATPTGRCSQINNG